VQCAAVMQLDTFNSGPNELSVWTDARKSRKNSEFWALVQIFFRGNVSSVQFLDIFKIQGLVG